MKIMVYSFKSSEADYIKQFSKKYQVELSLCKYAPDIENAQLAKGYECISIVTTKIDAQLLEKFHEVGVRFISTRTVGFEHIDIKRANELGIQVENVTYSLNSVADYTIMLMLMLTRKMKIIMERANVQDYSLAEVCGKEVPNMTVGVIGTGRIGQTVIKHLSGFGCKILAYDLYQNDEIKKYAEYVPLEKLYADSDIITIHVPATLDNYHIINKNSISLMKDGVYIINTARGSLIDTGSLIDAIEQKKVGGAALDVIENESEFFYKDFKSEVLVNRDFALLRSYPNVIITPHMAFYTENAVSDMVENSIISCISFMQGKKSKK